MPLTKLSILNWTMTLKSDTLSFMNGRGLIIEFRTGRNSQGIHCCSILLSSKVQLCRNEGRHDKRQTCCRQDSRQYAVRADAVKREPDPR